MGFTTTTNFVKNEYGDAPPNFGGDVACIQGVLLFSDASAVNIGIIPAGGTVIDWNVVEVTDFNAGTNNNFDLGITGTAAYFADDVAIGTQGVQRMGASGTVYTNIGTQFTAPTTIIATYAQSGTAASTGRAIVTVYYRVDGV